MSNKRSSSSKKGNLSSYGSDFGDISVSSSSGGGKKKTSTRGGGGGASSASTGTSGFRGGNSGMRSYSSKYDNYESADEDFDFDVEGNLNFGGMSDDDDPGFVSMSSAYLNFDDDNHKNNKNKKNKKQQQHNKEKESKGDYSINGSNISRRLETKKPSEPWVRNRKGGSGSTIIAGLGTIDKDDEDEHGTGASDIINLTSSSLKKMKPMSMTPGENSDSEDTLVFRKRNGRPPTSGMGFLDPEQMESFKKQGSLIVDGVVKKSSKSLTSALKRKKSQDDETPESDAENDKGENSSENGGDYDDSD